MYKNAMKIVLPLLSGIFFFATLALAEKANTITIYTNAVLPDGQELKAGEYRVVVDEKLDQLLFMKGSKVVVKHRCKCVYGQEKNQINEALFIEGPGKKSILQELRFRGETRVIHLQKGA